MIDLSLCSLSFSNALSLSLPLSITALRAVLSVMLLILAAISTLKESAVMYQVTKLWQPNHYMQQVMKDGILYFLVYVPPFTFLLVPFFHHHILRPMLLSHTCQKKLTTLNF